MDTPYYNRFKAGDTVVFCGYEENQVRWGANDTPHMLVVGNDYIVDLVEVHRSHTKVSLRGIDGKFNSVHFLSSKNDTLEHESTTK